MKHTALSFNERQPLALRTAVTAAVTAVLHVFVVAGAVPQRMEAPVAGAVDAVGLLVLLIWSVRSVTPNAKVITQVTTEGVVVAGDAAAAPTGSPVGVQPFTVSCQGTGTHPVVVTSGTGVAVGAVLVKPELVNNATATRTAATAFTTAASATAAAASATAAQTARTDAR